MLLTSRSVKEASIVAASKGASSPTRPWITGRNDSRLSGSPYTRVAMIFMSLRASVMKARRSIFMSFCLPPLRAPNLAFFLSFVRAAHDCRQRYVVQEFLLYPSTTSTTGMHHDAKSSSSIFHNLMHGVS